MQQYFLNVFLVSLKSFYILFRWIVNLRMDFRLCFFVNKKTSLFENQTITIYGKKEIYLEIAFSEKNKIISFHKLQNIKYFILHSKTFV